MTIKQKTPPTLSLCMVVKNEELLIENALSNAREFVDEIIVVDTGSSDKTPKLAKKFGAKVIYYKWDGSLGKARNEYLKLAKSEWIIVLDGDERIATRDWKKINKLIKDQKVLGYNLLCRDYTRNLNLLYSWHPNDAQYPYEQKISKCPGYFSYKIFRIFRNRDFIRYEEGYSVHTNPLKSLSQEQAKKIKDSDITVHNFQYLKGQEKFIVKKQILRLKNEIKHLALYPKDVLTHLNIAKTYFSLAKDSEALKYLNHLKKIDPKEFQIYFLLAMIAANKNDFPKAIAHIKKATLLKPKNADAWALLAIIYEKAEMIKEAGMAVKKTLKFHPQHLVAHNTFGLIEWAKGNLKSAEYWFKKAILIHPYFAEGASNLKQLQKEIKHSKTAKIKLYN